MHVIEMKNINNGDNIVLRLNRHASEGIHVRYDFQKKMWTYSCFYIEMNEAEVMGNFVKVDL